MNTKQMHIAAVVCLALLLSACLSVVSAQDRATEQEQILTWLQELKPLPKVHYSWPWPLNIASQEELLYQYVRLTHAVSLRGEGHYYNGKDITTDVIDQSVQLCKRINATNPKIPASLGVNYSVWVRRFGKDLPPTDTGETHKAELALLGSRLKRVQDDLAAANRKHGAGIMVTAILFDCERFTIRPDNARWNAALTAKYNAAYEVARKAFPEARVEWYARGAVQPGASATGWGVSQYFTLKEKGGSFACSLYRVPEIGITRETFRRTFKLAQQHGVPEVTPWIALASGYRRQPDKFHKWSFNWNYDLIYSWKLGAELNHAWFGQPERHNRFAPWNAAKIAVFYPEPFGRSPSWGEHFVAYVRGAHLIKKLPAVETQ